MKVRKLQKAEHIRTRKLWEEIFSEDTSEFLDYYYSVKAKNNEIYVVENEGHICAMLHLNPYTMEVAGESFTTHYIVAVATEEKYRHQGMMRMLLKEALSVMKANQEPFTFLMPAAEQIYYPHGFRYIYRQLQGKMNRAIEGKGSWEITNATKEDCKEIAKFSNNILQSRYEVFTKRDKKYYEVLLEEEKSERGGILIVKENQKIIGVFPYAIGEEYEIREPLFKGNADEILSYIFLYLGGKKQIKFLGYGDMEKSIIMAKILDVERMFSCVKIKETIELKLNIWDTLMDASIGCYFLKGSNTIDVEKIDETEECVCIEVGDLTSILFGMMDLEELNVPIKAKKELSKIIPLTKVYINEIV